jgi:hypothetical protein
MDSIMGFRTTGCIMHIRSQLRNSYEIVHMTGVSLGNTYNIWKRWIDSEPLDQQNGA